MEKVKIFYVVDDPKGLENQINEWLNSTSIIEITRVLQSSSGRLDHHTTVTIFYR
jgi:hypothetical protein